MLSHPPFGVKWKKIEKDTRQTEHKGMGHAGASGRGGRGLG